MAAAVACSYKLDKLVGTNYLAWRVKMEMCLTHLDLWGIVSGTEVNPSSIIPAPGAPAIDPATHVTAQDAWNLKDLSARMEIILHLPSQVTILKKLINLEMKSEQSADTFVDEW